jgi:membrane fusion protein, copper/silver efflux system
VEVEFSTAIKTGITVPADAVVKDGNQNRVYVQREDGSFESRQVEVETTTVDDGIEIVRGLKPGESIVVSGTFLVDAEARLNHGAAVISPVQDTSSPETKREQAMNARGGHDD